MLLTFAFKLSEIPYTRFDPPLWGVRGVVSLMVLDGLGADFAGVRAVFCGGGVLFSAGRSSCGGADFAGVR